MNKENNEECRKIYSVNSHFSNNIFLQSQSFFFANAAVFLVRTVDLNSQVSNETSNSTFFVVLL